MVVYQCAECEAKVSRSVVDLVDLSLLRTNPNEHVFFNQTGNPDMVPKGSQIAGPTKRVPSSRINGRVAGPEPGRYVRNEIRLRG